MSTDIPPHDRSFWRQSRVCVTGGAGFVGRVLCRKLRDAGCEDIFIPRRRDYDLTEPGNVRRLYDDAQPDIVFHLAALVGGIGANRANPGRFFHANLAMGMNLIEQARRTGLKKFVQVGTVCSYPKHCPVPFRERDLWNGYPEETNAPYGIAKKALLVMLQAYRAEYGLNGIFVMPVNLYGPGDNFDPHASHVIPALIRKFVEARESHQRTVQCWGTGRPSREFLYVDDAADALLAAGERYESPHPVNLGTGREISIRELANLIAETVGFEGGLVWDESQPDGQPRRQLDVSLAARSFGWRAKTELREGLRRTVDWWIKEGLTHARQTVSA